MNVILLSWEKAAKKFHNQCVIISRINNSAHELVTIYSLTGATKYHLNDVNVFVGWKEMGFVWKDLFKCRIIYFSPWKKRAKLYTYYFFRLWKLHLPFVFWSGKSFTFSQDCNACLSQTDEKSKQNICRIWVLMRVFEYRRCILVTV